MTEAAVRDQMVAHGRSLYERGLAHGSSGNLSARLDDGFLVTPTNVCLGRLDPARISTLDSTGQHIGGDPPSKEAFLHVSLYAKRPKARGIVHLHCTHAVAVSCLCHADPTNVLPPITAYHVMKVGRLPLVPYYPPGDVKLADAVAAEAEHHRAMLLANHGPVVSATSLDDAVYAAEELEETAKLFLLLRGADTQFLSAPAVAELTARFPD
jgi:ribulose-5-phosphate 4-epimerase/fuculose-1-phosphate aldolase